MCHEGMSTIEKCMVVELIKVINDVKDKELTIWQVTILSIIRLECWKEKRL